MYFIQKLVRYKFYLNCTSDLYGFDELDGVEVILVTSNIFKKRFVSLTNF